MVMHYLRINGGGMKSKYPEFNKHTNKENGGGCAELRGKRR